MGKPSVNRPASLTDVCDPSCAWKTACGELLYDGLGEIIEVEETTVFLGQGDMIDDHSTELQDSYYTAGRLIISNRYKGLGDIMEAGRLCVGACAIEKLVDRVGDSKFGEAVEEKINNLKGNN